MNHTQTKILPDGTVKKIYKVVVHNFLMGDVEDPDVMAGSKLWEWEHSEVGKFIMEKAIEVPSWHRHLKYELYSWEYSIVAELYEDDLTYFNLKWK